MPAINPSTPSKVAYMYDATTLTWYPIAGVANTTVDYEWQGVHVFNGLNTIINSVDTSVKHLIAKNGVNIFPDATNRDDDLNTPPAVGTVCYLTNPGKLEIYNGSDWISLTSSTLSTKTDDYTLTQHDAGKTIIVDSASDKTITISSGLEFASGERVDIIRKGSGNVTIGGAVSILSKNSNKKIAAQYSGATLIKTDDTDTWILIGDLTA